MNNLIKFISKYHIGLIFMFLELIAILLIVQNNRYHRAGFINSSNFITGTVYSKYKSTTIYLNLKEENEKLVAENADLQNKLKSYNYTLIPKLEKDSNYALLATDTHIVDTLNYFKYIPALAISNSVNKKYNYIYINKGNKDGIRNDMGVVEANGVIGVVVNSTKNYAVVMPLVNEKSNISVKIKNQGYFGTLNWEVGSGLSAEIKEIPNHVILKKGDTIFTSGYSQIFPKDLMIGTVEESQKIEGQSALKIKVKLAVNFSKINYTYVIENSQIEKIKELYIE